MTLISRLFKKKIVATASSKKNTSKQGSLSKEQQSINKLDQLSADEVVSIAVGEYDQNLRIAAINKLPYGEALKKLAFGCTASKIQVSARQRIAALVDTKELGFDRLGADISDKVALLAIAGFSQQVELQDQVLSGSDDEHFLSKVALEGASVKLRQAAAQRITERDCLEQLLKQSKGKDKTVYRIVKDKCDAFKEQDKHKQQLKQDVDSLCSALQRLCNRAFDPMFTANFHHLEEQWSSLQTKVDNDVISQYAERIDQALSDCAAIVAEQVRAQAEQAQKQQAIANAATVRESILTELKQLVISQFVADTLAEDAVQVLAQVLEKMQQRWNDVLQYVPASTEQSALYQQLIDAIGFLGEQFQRNGPLPQQLKSLLDAGDEVSVDTVNQLRQRMKPSSLLTDASLPPLVTEALNFIQTFEQQQQAKKEAARQFNRQLSGLIRRAIEAIDRGQIRQAAGIRRSIDEKLNGIAECPPGISDQLERLNEKLDQLQDWRSYAVQPKMEELVEQMRALTTSALDPTLLADKIKHLQEQWKLLSKGGGSQYQALWDSFHELAQTAYEPCKIHFQQQSDIRQQNLQKRKQLVAQLGDFFNAYDWDNVDWKMVEKMVRVARQEWRDYSPTERSATKPVQVAFNKQLDAIYQHLEVEYKKNAAIKQALIDQAEQLVTNEDTRASIEQVKQLQAQWQAVGVTQRKVDQALWKAFRTHCDAVFDRRQQESTQFKAQLNESLDQARALCCDIEALSVLTGQDLLNARAEFERLKAAFNALGEMPKNAVAAIRSKFNTAVQRFETQLVEHTKQAKEKLWSDLLAVNTVLANYTLSVSSSLASDKTGDTDIASVQSAIDAIERWPKGGKEAIEKKLAGISDGVAVDLAANEAVLRELCIRMEILAGTQTPDCDQAMRMEYQVKRLQQGLGQSVRDTRTVMADLIFEWIAAGPVAEPLYTKLIERFNQSRAKAI